MRNKWNKLHKHYSNQDWIDKPNIFAEEVLEYIPSTGKILLLGDGQGQDGRFFAAKKYDVISTDISDTALRENKKKIKEPGLTNIKVEKVDLRKKIPYKENTFDVVYAHLSLHYFSEETTH